MQIMNNLAIFSKTQQNQNMQNPLAFKGLHVNAENLDEIETLLGKSGFKFSGFHNTCSMFPLDVDSLIMKINVDQARESIKSDKEFKLIAPKKGALIIAKTNVETQIKEVLDKAKIFVKEIKNL